MPDRSPASLVAGGLVGWSHQNVNQEDAGATQGSMECVLESILVCLCL